MNVIPAGDVVVAPSLLSADFGALAAAIDSVAPETPWLHLDVMDGHFVPNITIGPPVVASLRRHSSLFFDCHLMITNPERYLEVFAKAGADLCSVHAELDHTEELISQMRSLGLHVGLVINPETSFSVAAPYLDRIDLLLIMSVHPGFGGQSFIADVLPKIKAARAAIDEGGHPVVLEVDGGIDTKTAPLAAKAGARVFVSGSAVFSSSDPLQALVGIHDVARDAIGGA